MTDLLKEATPRPHICGDPSDPCDYACMERAMDSKIHERLWHEWYGLWHDADASRPKPSYEEWLEARLLQVERAAKEPIDTSTWFYKNCKRQRKNLAKICQVCPFRARIEAQEAAPRRLVEGVEGNGPACNPYEGMTAGEKDEYLRRLVGG